MRIQEIKNHHVARFILLVLGVLIFLGAYYSANENNSENNKEKSLNNSEFSSQNESSIELKIKDKTYIVELAINNEQRQKGLGGRDFLAENTGMLFVFDKPDNYSFWMKDTLIPLDIIWISAEKKIIYLKEDVKPESFPETFSPNMDALYVLELSAGEVKKSFFEIGDKVDFILPELD